MGHIFLLDEMLDERIATQLSEKGHDVTCVVANPTLVSLSDDQILAEAARSGRTLVTLNYDKRMIAAAQAADLQPSSPS